MRNSLVLVGLSGLAVGFVIVYASLPRRESAAAAPPATLSATGSSATHSAPSPPDEASSAQLFARNRGLPSDPDLADEYEQINVEYFKNALPAPAVRWETGLAELGPLIADGFRVLGLTDGKTILLNPSIERDRDQRRRALCHEMTHMAVWKQDVAHGPIFQDRLRRLSEQGAFKGIVATDEDKDATLATLGRKHTALEAEERALQADHKSLDRTSQAAVNAYNARVLRYREDVADYNRLVEQYNLMVSYPDGLARERLKSRSDETVH